MAGRRSSVLLFSMRRVAQLVAYCIEYEFEDVVTELTWADRIEVERESLSEFSRRLYKYTRLLSGSRRLGRVTVAAHPALRLNRDYELFFPIFNEPYELFALAAVPDWRRRCKVAACFISEVWIHNCPEYLLELLAEFDHVFLGVQHSIGEVARIVGRPCTYLPLAVDVLRFAPPRESITRSINVCNIGRRSPVTHEALLKLASDPGFFYYYDTVAASGVDLRQRTFRVQDPREHRLLLASLLKRSRYYLAHRGFVNDPDSTKGREEISARFYEGAAAGTVMIGAAPESEEFARQFDWLDPVIRTPFDCSEIGRVLEELDSDPQRLARIRRDNVRNAALRHDWLHRLQSVFEVLGLPPTDAMCSRERNLNAVAAQALDGTPTPGLGKALTG